MPPPTETCLAAGDRRVLSLDDLASAAGLPPLLLLSWLLPTSRWPALCRAMAPLAAGMLPARPQAFAAAVERTLGGRDVGLEPGAILPALAAEHVLSLLQLLRAYRPGGWRPRLPVDGLAHLEAGLAAGRGVVLWLAYTAAGDVAAKMAFHRIGLRVHHLSRPSHGFSGTRFGTRVLNRVQTTAEDRYLGARVMLDPAQPAPALAALAAELARNGVVSLTARADARRPVEVPFLAGRLKLAPGAPALARRTGAALLPAFAFREAADTIRVTVAPSLEAPAEAAPEAAVEALCRQYAEVLAPHVSRHPGQWRGWLQL